MVIWLMFAILGVSLFGGGTHQCVRLSDASGYPGCGIDLGSKSYTSDIACRYTRSPLPSPDGVIPGLTTSSGCGCVWEGKARTCQAWNNSLGEELAWLPSYPSFDTTSKALLALLQISTLDGCA